ncbi:MAG: hypothetical protein JKY90_05690 [Gammaproteobacteria bacterium]|nr:hypothetical protein [Gammaproteobacteria bacterium]
MYESFSDLALLMLAAFVFLFVIILITYRIQDTYEVPRLKKELAVAQAELDRTQKRLKVFQRDINEMNGLGADAQVEIVLEGAGLDEGQGRKDFELFVEGLRDIPGTTIHMVIDGTGSMHGAATFLIPVLRVIALRSGKDLDAVTWFSDGRGDTYSGSMSAMLDALIDGAPFTGSQETIGAAFKRAEQNADIPSAYILIGDEPSDDRIFYKKIKAPVFTLPLGRINPATRWEYETLAQETGGKMLWLQFK